MKGLLAAEDAPDSSPAVGGSVEDEHLDDAFDAAGKDRKAFRAAMKAAIRACVDSYDSEETE